jgi:hypothetical protein
LPIATKHVLTAALVALAAPPSSVLAEASHHAGAAGQLVSPALVGDARVLTDSEPPQWDLRLFPSMLRSTGSFDDHGMRSALVGADRITLAALNVFAERRFGAAWAVSAATSFQRIEAVGPAETTSFTDLGDSLLSARHGTALSFGNLSIAASVKIPGSYPDSALTSAKQVDAEGKAILARRVGTRVTVAGGVGYRLRLGDVEDEVTAYAAVPVQLASAWTVTAIVAAGIPVGAGAVAKNSVLPGLSLEWTPAPKLAVSAGYQRTAYGRNVADADVFSFGVGRTF